MAMIIGKGRLIAVTFVLLVASPAIWKLSTSKDNTVLLTREDGYDKASESPWAGVPALIEEVNGSTIFRYQNNDVKDKYGKQLVLLDVYKKRFDWPPQEYVSLSKNTDVSRGFVFVTGSSANHFAEMLSTLSSIQQFAPGVNIIFWDLGLNDDASVQKIQSLCDVEYRKLNFSTYPAHVRHLKNYAFKPVVLAETMKDHPRLVWMDTSIRFINTGNFSHIKQQIVQTGGVLGMLKVDHSIFSATHKQLYEYLPIVMEKVKQPGIIGGGFLVFYRTETVFKNIFLFWVLCSLDVHCIQPTKALGCNAKKMRKGEYAGCHRFDQSTISILMGNLYNYNIAMYRDYMAKGDKGDFVKVVRAPIKNPTMRTCTHSK